MMLMMITSFKSEDGDDENCNEDEVGDDVDDKDLNDDEDGDDVDDDNLKKRKPIQLLSSQMERKSGGRVMKSTI